MKRVFFPLLVAVMFFRGGAAVSTAQTLKPFTTLRVIQTEFFDIIYPPASEPTARTLALRVDPVYRQVSALLGISFDRRVPVLITPHTDQFNGYMAPLPYPHIVLYDTPMDIGWTSFENSLESLFLHEMTHAVSLNTRNAFYRGLYRIFGGWALPALLTAPLFMVEGVTVSFESLGGFGRAHDPLIRQKLLQDIYEDAFLSPFQAAGVDEYPHGRGAYYEYGGLFSAWLQGKYGMEKYARLWQAMGSGQRFSFFFYNSGFFSAFKEVYDLPFLDAWNDFRSTLVSETPVFETIEENPLQRAYEGVRGSGRKRQALITATAAGAGRVFFLDGVAGKALAFDPGSGKTRAVLPVDAGAYGLDVPADGGRLLVSSYRYTGSLARAVVTEYPVAGGRKRVWEGLYNGRYFRDGLIGLSSTLHGNNLVFRSASGDEEVLLRGSAELLYASPAALNDAWIAFIAARRGVRELCLYNYRTGAVYTLSSGLEDDGDKWRYIRFLQASRGDRASGGRLFFSFNHDGGMYKLGMVDLGGLGEDAPPDTLEAVFTLRNFSGGVFLPVMVEDVIYYRAAFSAWDALLQYPEAGSALAGQETRLFLRPWTAAELASAGRASAPATEEPVTTAAAGAGIAGEDPASASQPLPPGMESRRYSPFPYLNPFRLWMPLPLVRFTGESLSLDGGGLFSIMQDPADLNQIVLFAFMDVDSLMAAVNLQWTNLGLGFPLTIAFSDDIVKTSAIPYRLTRGTVSGSLNFGLGNERRRLEIMPGLGFSRAALDRGDGSSAYTWEPGAPYYSAVLGLGLSNLRRLNWEMFGQGAALAGYGRFLLAPSVGFRFEAILQTAFEPYLPLKLSFYGAWDEKGMDLHGNSRYYTTSVFSSIASTEYPGGELSALRWIGGGEAELRLFSLEPRKNLSHLYYNRFFGTLAYRGVLYQDPGLSAAEGSPLGDDYRLGQSLILKLGVTVSTIVVTFMPIKLSAWIWGAWKFPNMNDGKNNDWAIGWDFGPRFSITY
jgi:hypothetical protein